VATKVVEQRLELEGDTLRLINLVAYSAHSRNVGRRFREATGFELPGAELLASSPMPTRQRWSVLMNRLLTQLTA
jgi:hypothetical protein